MEYEVGGVYTFRGKRYRFLGGDPSVRSNWEEVTEAPTAAPAEQGGGFGDFAATALHGFSFGFADEILDKLGYDGAAQRERVERYREQHPVAAFGAELLGGAVMPGGVVKSLGGSLVKRGLGRIAAGAISGAATGAAGGALYGAGESDPGERLRGAVVGGGVGAATGGALGTVSGIAGRVVGKVTGGEAADYARRDIRRALEAAGVDPAEMMQRLRELPEGSVLADLGPNVADAARAAANQAPAARAPGGPVSRIRARQAGRGDRLAQDIRTASGLTKTFDESVAEAKELLEGVREAYYRPLERMYTSIDGPNVLAALEDPRIAPLAGRVTRGNPSFTQLQDILMDLRDEMLSARASRRPHRSQQMHEAYEMLVRAIEADVPEFRPAQQAFRIAQQRLDAHKLGQKFAFKTPSEIQAEMSRMPTEAHDAFRQGMLDRWETSLRERRGGGAKAAQLLDGGETMRERLRLLAESDPALDQLLSGIEREYRWTETFHALRGNSTTPRQLSDMLDQIPRGVTQAVWQMVSQIFGLGPEQRRAAAELTAQVLLSDGEEAARKFANELAVRYSLSGAIGGTAGTVMGGRAASLFDD